MNNQNLKTADGADLPELLTIWRRRSTGEYVRIKDTLADYRGKKVFAETIKGGTLQYDLNTFLNFFIETDLEPGAAIPKAKLPTKKEIKQFFKD